MIPDPVHKLGSEAIWRDLRRYSAERGFDKAYTIDKRIGLVVGFTGGVGVGAEVNDVGWAAYYLLRRQPESEDVQKKLYLLVHTRL